MLRSLASYLGMRTPESTIAGQLLSVQGSVIGGWLQARGEPDETLLKVTVNKRCVPVRVRFEPSASSDVPHRFNFSAELESDLGYAEGLVVGVTYGKEKAQLAGSPWYVRQGARYDFPYAFLHIPKTAGTSLRFALEYALGASRVFPCQEYIQRRGGRYLTAREAKPALAGLSDDIELIQGHFGLKQLRDLAPNAKVIAVFRDPVDRVISLMKHKMAAYGDIDALEESLIRKYLHVSGGASNGQVRALSGGRGGSLGRESLKEAVAALDQIDVVGISEQYNDVLVRASELVGKPLGHGALNRSRVPDREFSEHLISQVREANQLDIEFYEAVKSKLASGG